MPRKRKLADLSDRCRFCLARDACMTPLFDSKHLADQLKDMQKCTEIEISNKANYPNNICHVCLYKLETWTEFKSQFLKTNNTLINHFKLFEENENDYTVNNEVISNDIVLSVESSNKRFKSNENSVKNYSIDKRPFISLVDIKPIIDPKTGNVQNATEILKKFNELPKKFIEIPKKEVEETTSNKFTQEKKFIKPNEDEKSNISANQFSLSDSQNRTNRRPGRPRKFAREASTKRWVERKNALIVATGEKPSSESESDNDTQMSPAQKAREEMKQKKVDREMKYLHTNLTDKYYVKEDNINSRLRNTRSRRSNIDKSNTVTSETLKESITTEIKEELINDKKEKKKGVPKVEIIDKEKQREELPKDLSDLHEVKKIKVDEPKEEVKQKNQEKNEGKENVKIVENETVEDNVKKVEVQKEIEMKNQKSNIKIEVIKNNDVEASRLEAANQLIKNNLADLAMAELLNKNVNILENSDNSFTPQLVTSEVTIGNATYIITTTLDMPNSISLKGDVSVKTNGINSTSQSGEKIDIMNAVQLQKVDDEKEGIQSDSKQNDTEIQKCLKIEIEGMEVEALQRVQLDLAHFINENTRKRLIAEAEGNRKIVSKTDKFVDSYQNLNYQLQEIIEKVLRNQYSSEKNFSKNKKNPRLLMKPFKNQPKITVTQLNIPETNKDLKVDDFDELEESKMKTHISSTLHRTAGKRRLVLPKKYEDYSLNLRPIEDQVEEKKPVVKLIPNKIVFKINNTSLIEPSSSEKTLDSSIDLPEQKNELITNNDVNEAVKEAIKSIELQEKEDSTLLKEPLTNEKIVSTPSVLKSVPMATSTPAVTIIKTAAPTLSSPTTPLNQVSKISITKKTVSTDTSMSPTSTSARTTCSVVPTKRSNEEKTSPMPKRERHVCGMCGKELFSTQEANAHMEQHRVEINNKDKQSKPATSTTATSSSANAPTSTAISNLLASANNTLKPKPKLMRCKRCQAIVEAKHVKTHVCNSVKYSCDLCECTFGAQHLLMEHRQTHTQSRNKLKNTITMPNAPAVSSIVSSSTASKSTTKIIKLNPVKSNLVKELPRFPINVDDTKEPKTVPKSKKRSAKVRVPIEEDEPSKSCFVCDMVFSSDEQIKDHLQMHCEEVSDSIEKDNFTCAFCANKFSNEEQLEEHVNVHLNEDGDEKISMMIDAQMEARRDRQRKAYKCEQCNENFLTASLLEMHAAMHDEEEPEVEDDEEATAADADELNNLDNPDEPVNDHVCEVCDEIFDTEVELKVHRESHSGSSHVCILCEMPFVSIKELQEHVSTHL